MACGSAIQSARWSGVLGRVPAARVRRLETWVRSGPFPEPALVPRMVWQSTQGPLMKTSWPRFSVSVAGGRAACLCACNHPWKSSIDSTTTGKAMWAC
jgi:hypothetical protein